MAQRTSIKDDIGVKSPLSIEALGPCDRLKIPKKIGPSKPLIIWRAKRQPPSSRLIANSFIVGGFLAFVRWKLATAVHLNIGVMRDATFCPVIPHFLADKGIWIFAPNVAARADIAPSRQHFFHYHLRLLSSGALACRIKKSSKGLISCCQLLPTQYLNKRQRHFWPCLSWCFRRCRYSERRCTHTPETA